MKNWIYLLLITLSFVLYGNSVFNNYSLDDENVIKGAVENGIAGIPEIISSRYGERDNVKLDYRPVVLISFALEHQFFKQSPHISHFINIVLYAICLIVLYNVLISVFSLHKIQEWLPLIITVFYAIHPIHTEVVNSLKNRDELFGLLFGLLFLKYGFYFFTKKENRLKYATFTILFFTLTLLSKLVGILYMPLLILVLFYNRLLKWNKWNYLLLSGTFLILAILIWVTASGLKRNFYSFENSLVGVKDLSIIFPTCFKIILYHIKMLILPFPLRFYYGYNLFPLDSAFEPSVLISIIFHVGLLIFGIWKIWKKDILGLLILSYLTCMFLYFNYPIPYVGMFSERALLVSSIWFVAIVVILLFRLAKKVKSRYLNYFIFCFSFFVFVSYSYQTIQRNFYWKNGLTLYNNDIKNLENSVAANYIYANALNNESSITTDSIYSVELALKAITHYQQCIDLYPYYPDYFYQMAKLYRYKLNDANKAEKILKNMLEVDSNFVGANYELGKIYFEKKDFRNSYPYLKKAYLANPTDSLTLFYVAQNALAVGDLNNSYKINNELMNLYPNIKYPYLNLGVYYSTILKDDSAIIYFEKGIALGERNPDLLKNMVIYFDKKKEINKAKYYQNLLDSI